MQRYLKWIPLVLVVIVIVSGLIFFIVHLLNGHTLPCDFLDSVNITDGTLQSDSSIIFENISYPSDQYFNINYDLRNGSKTRINMNSTYIRGCMCKIRPCIRLCCPEGVFYNHVNFKCENHTNDLAKNFVHDILDRDNNTESWILDDHFAFAHAKPCQGMFIADDGFDIIYVILENKNGIFDIWKSFLFDKMMIDRFIFVIFIEL